MAEQFAPDRVIDREKEVRAFNGIVTSDAGPNIMLIQDARTGAGKSELLRLLKHHAAMTQAPVALVDLKGSADRYQVLETTASQLRDAGVRLTQYERWNRIRLAGDVSQFRDGQNLDSVQVHIDGSTLEGSSVVGAQINISGTWGPGLERLAQEECMGAFLDDLHETSREQTIVLLFDHHDDASDDVKAWLLAVSRSHFFEVEHRYARLVIVLAGHYLPVAELRGILGQDRFAQCAIPFLDGLSQWEERHVLAWLKSINVEWFPGDPEAIRSRLAKDWTIDQVKEQLYNRRAE